MNLLPKHVTGDAVVLPRCPRTILEMLELVKGSRQNCRTNKTTQEWDFEEERLFYFGLMGVIERIKK